MSITVEDVEEREREAWATWKAGGGASTFTREDIYPYRHLILAPLGIAWWQWFHALERIRAGEDIARVVMDR